jgi:NAD(P)-dependent dehydrogenase (short-subunit alcohol dehydrogenase family)
MMKEKGLFDLSGKVVAVTGAGSGLGRIFCEAMAEHGAHVVCADINEEWAAETSSLTAKYGVGTISVKADVSSQDEVKALFQKIDRKFGRLDVLFNNAGIATRGMKIHEMPLKEWQRVIDVNLTGTFLCMQEGIKLMLRQGIGSIINISSVLGLVAADPDILVTPNYVASKHGVIGLTKSAAVQYAADNIRVNAIAPGFFGGTRLADVEKRDNKQKQASSSKVSSLTPLARLGRPEELKGIAVLLASDKASSFITGETFVVDGGWCAW